MSLRSGDWFGCGRKITQKSWDGFLKARKEYYAKLDASEAASHSKECQSASTQANTSAKSDAKAEDPSHPQS